MKHILILLILSVSTLHAQVPNIDYMIADEAKSQLQIHGTFGSDHTGSASIEGIPCSVRFWSDTMVICDLPDSGAGSGGHVTVQQMSGTSNAKMLSIFICSDSRSYYQYETGGFQGPYYITRWFVKWRADISNINQPSSYSFEASKVSNGTADCSAFDTYHWADTMRLSDSSIHFKGIINLNTHSVLISAPQISAHCLPSVVDDFQIPLGIMLFDSTGTIIGFSTATYAANFKLVDIMSDVKILFPPAAKNSVIQFPEPSSDLIKIFSHIGSEDNLISLEAEEPLGETTASLYSIDGRLLKQEKIFILSPGMYSFDASGINASFGFLVIKTSKGIVTEKVMF